MVIWLEQDADLHMAQSMPLPLTVSCFSKIQIVFFFLVPAHPGSPSQRAEKWVCVCVWDEFSGMKITSISLWSTVEVETYQGSFSSEGFCHRTLPNCFFNSSVSWLFSAVSNSLIVEHRAVSIYIEIFFSRFILEQSEDLGSSYWSAYGTELVICNACVCVSICLCVCIV